MGNVADFMELNEVWCDGRGMYGVRRDRITRVPRQLTGFPTQRMALAVPAGMLSWM